MLREITIENLAIIDKQTIHFSDGLTVITGETGAGKSILLTSLGLALGQRSNNTIIRHDSNRASISAIFDISRQPNIINWLKERGLDSDQECIIRRVLTTQGSGKIYINDQAVSLSLLKTLGALLVDIHNQNEHYSLIKTSTQQLILDDYANTLSLVDEIGKIKHAHHTISERINSIKAHNTQQNEHRQLLSYFISELHQAALDPDELNSIEKRAKQATHAQSLIDTLATITDQLTNEAGVSNQLHGLCADIQKACALDEQLNEVQTLLDNAHINAQEAAYSLSQYLSALSYDEQQTNALYERLDELNTLAAKHRIPMSALLDKHSELKQELAELEHHEKALNELEQQLAELTQNYQLKATELSTKRRAAAHAFADEVTQLMHTLGMAGSVFEVKLENKSDGIYSNGNECVGFFIQTNVGSAMLPIAKVASGGELSRISLAIAVTSSSGCLLPSVVFDEVDVGISGAVAEIVGQKLHTLASTSQVICITHLAQVAALGDHHLKVVKHTSDTSTELDVIALHKHDKVDEVARLLGGINITEKTRTLAQEMTR